MHMHDIIIFTNSYFVAYTETESESLHHVRLLVYSLVYSGLKKKNTTVLLGDAKDELWLLLAKFCLDVSL